MVLHWLEGEERDKLAPFDCADKPVEKHYQLICPVPAEKNQLKSMDYKIEPHSVMPEWDVPGAEQFLSSTNL